LICHLEIKTLYSLEPLFLLYFSELKQTTLRLRLAFLLSPNLGRWDDEVWSSLVGTTGGFSRNCFPSSVL